MVRNGVRAAFAATSGIELIGEARDGREAEVMALKLEPHVILMDLYMPNQNGIRTMLNIRKKLPDVKVLILTVSAQEEDLLRAVRFGADGFLLKSSDLSEVIDAVKRVAAGEAILSPWMTAKVLKELNEEKRKPILSGREQEVLELIARGLNNAEIAARLFVSPGTISTYIYRLLQKLHLKNRAEAIAYALRRNAHPEPF